MKGKTRDEAPRCACGCDARVPEKRLTLHRDELALHRVDAPIYASAACAARVRQRRARQKDRVEPHARADRGFFDDLEQHVCEVCGEPFVCTREERSRQYHPACKGEAAKIRRVVLGK